MNPKIGGSDIAGKTIVFYLFLTFMVLLSIYFSSLAFAAYLLIIAALHMIKKKEGGFRWGSSWRFGFLFGFILISSIFLLEYWLGWIRLKDLVQGAYYILMLGLIFELLVSAGEEMAFRGYILPNLMGIMGRRSAVISTAILFAGLHIPSMMVLDISPFNSLIMFASITVAGVILARLYLIGGLKMAVGFHFSWNFFQYHVFSMRSGFGIFGIEVERPLFTGGIAGPEAGIMGLAALLMGAAMVKALSPDMRKA